MSQLNKNEISFQGTVGAVAVTSTATLVADRTRQRVSLALRNAGSTTLYYGFAASVTAATGYPILANEEYVFTEYAGPVYIVCATTGDLRFAEAR